jgi:CheY-like chemotaxis protein
MRPAESGGRNLTGARSLYRRPEDRAMSRASTILVVEDDPLILEWTADSLAEGGLEVLRATSSEEALVMLERGPIPLFVVTDIKLAGSSGLELARTVAERWPEVRLVIVSGEQRPVKEDYPEKAVFFTKPYAEGALLSIINAPVW